MTLLTEALRSHYYWWISGSTMAPPSACKPTLIAKNKLYGIENFACGGTSYRRLATQGSWEFDDGIFKWNY